MRGTLSIILVAGCLSLVLIYPADAAVIPAPRHALVINQLAPSADGYCDGPTRILYGLSLGDRVDVSTGEIPWMDIQELGVVFPGASGHFAIPP